MDDRPALLPAPGVSLLYQPDGSWAALVGYAQFTQEAPSWSGPGPDPSTALVAETTHFRVPGHKPRRPIGVLSMSPAGRLAEIEHLHAEGLITRDEARTLAASPESFAYTTHPDYRPFAYTTHPDYRPFAYTTHPDYRPDGCPTCADTGVIRDGLTECGCSIVLTADAQIARAEAEAADQVACAKARAVLGKLDGFRTPGDRAGEYATMRNAATPCRHAVTDNVTTSLGRVLLCCDCGMHIDGNPGDARAK